MRRFVLPLVVVLLAAFALSGCGEEDNENFSDNYKVLNDRLLKVGEDLGKGLQTAKNKSNKALSEQFAGFALRLEAINKDLRELEAPDDLREDSDLLALRIDDTIKSIRDISGAAGNGDPQAAAAATVELSTNSQALNRAQNKLARATGAKVGQS